MVTWNINRPANVNLDHTGSSLGLNSIQTLCLVRNTPLFGDVVPLSKQNWNLLLLLLGHHWDTLTFQRKEYGPMSLYHFEESGVVDELVMSLSIPQHVSCTNWVKIDGTEYRIGLIVCNEIQHKLPVFSRITQILLMRDSMYFLVNPLVTLSFNEHYHAFTVCDGEEKEAVFELQSLCFYSPFHLQCSYGPDNSIYVVLLHCLI